MIAVLPPNLWLRLYQKKLPTIAPAWNKMLAITINPIERPEREHLPPFLRKLPLVLHVMKERKHVHFLALLETEEIRLDFQVRIQKNIGRAPAGVGPFFNLCKCLVYAKNELLKGNETKYAPCWKHSAEPDSEHFFMHSCLEHSLLIGQFTWHLCQQVSDNPHSR